MATCTWSPRRRSRPVGVRAISRRTGLAPETISAWLRIDRRPALKAAVERERLDIGRAMKLVSAPEAVLEVLIEQAGRLSQQELSATVAAARRECAAVAERRVASNRSRAAAALNALLLIDEVSEPVREQLQRVRLRVEALLTAAERPHSAQPMVGTPATAD